MHIRAFALALLLLLFTNVFGQIDSTYYQKAVARATQCQFEKAVILFDKAIEASPQNPYVWFNLGFTKSMLDQNEEDILCISYPCK